MSSRCSIEMASPSRMKRSRMGPVCPPGCTHRQPLATVASSSANQKVVTLTGVVSKKVASWCQRTSPPMPGCLKMENIWYATPMSTPKRKAFSYIRFSHPSQAAGDSYDRQHRLAVAYCKENNLDLVSDTEYTFFDRGRSAFHGKNVDATGELRRFLNLVEDKSIPRGSVLIVE